MNETKKQLLRDFVNHTCENCGKTELQSEGKLQPHRIKRGTNGGEYNLRNIMMLCDRCHKLMHSNEFRFIKNTNA